jgi:hypothetical protein
LDEVTSGTTASPLPISMHREAFSLWASGQYASHDRCAE